MRRRVILCLVAFTVACGLVRILPLHLEVDWSGYRHWRITQTKPLAGASMTIDDMWWTQTSGDHPESFLRILCHWNKGFPLDYYHLRAGLLDAHGKEITGMLTWYVPVAKTRFTPPGVTPFFWEFSTTPPAGKDVRFRVHYASNRLTETNGTVEPDQTPGYVDFTVPNVAIKRDMSCPDIFAPKPLWWASYQHSWRGFSPP